MTPPSEIAERLGLKAGDKALIRRRQMYAGGQPMQLATSYVPWSFAEGTQMDSGPGGIYSRLADRCVRGTGRGVRARHVG